MRRVIGLLCALSAAFLLVPVALAQSDADATFEQQIVPNNCVYTTVETGLGMVNDSTCPAFAPTIEIVNANSGRPIITGIYDAVHTEVFRVQVAGVWYVLGIDPQLTADGNVWVLDLSDLAQALPAGEYTIVAEAIMDDGQTFGEQAAVHISEEAVGPDTPNTGLRPVSFLPIIAALTSGAGLFILSIAIFYSRRYSQTLGSEK